MEDLAAVELPLPASRADRARSLIRTVARSLSGWCGIVLVVVPLGIAFAGPFLSPYSPTALVGKPRSGPSSAHLLGTDALGRDLLSRVLNGGADAILVPVLAIVVAFLIGASIGLWSGFAGGWRDFAAARVVDVLIALPPMLLAIVFIASFGSSTRILVTVTAIFFVPRTVRVVRGATASVVTQDYVEAARLRGDSLVVIVRRELIPNLYGVLLVEFASRLANVVIFVATLNFLGLGAQPPSSSWGLMVSETRELLRANPLAPLVPALLIAALAVGVSLLADLAAQHLTRAELGTNAI